MIKLLLFPFVYSRITPNALLSLSFGFANVEQCFVLSKAKLKTFWSTKGVLYFKCISCINFPVMFSCFQNIHFYSLEITCTLFFLNGRVFFQRVYRMLTLPVPRTTKKQQKPQTTFLSLWQVMMPFSPSSRCPRTELSSSRRWLKVLEFFF